MSKRRTSGSTALDKIVQSLKNYMFRTNTSPWTLFKQIDADNSNFIESKELFTAVS